MSRTSDGATSTDSSGRLGNEGSASSNADGCKGTVTVIDPATNIIVDQIGVGANSLAVSPIGSNAGYSYGSWGLRYAMS